MHERYEKFTNCRSISHSMAEMVQCGDTVTIKY